MNRGRIRFGEKWFLILFLLIITIAFVALSKSLHVESKDFINSVLGFWGAILGGAITLIGVRMTIKDEDKRHHLSKHFEVLSKISNIKLKLIKSGITHKLNSLVNQNLESGFSSDNEQDLSDSKELIHSIEQYFVDLSGDLASTIGDLNLIVGKGEVTDVLFNLYTRINEVLCSLNETQVLIDEGVEFEDEEVVLSDLHDLNREIAVFDKHLDRLISLLKEKYKAL